MIKALLLIYAIWGFNWVAMKEATLFFPPVLFACYRFAVGAAILLAVNVWLKLPLPPRRYWKWIALTGLLQIAGNNAAMQMGIKDLDAGLVAVLNYSMPVWVAILAHFFLNEKLTKRKALGVVVSMIGLVILMHIDSLGNASSLFITIGGAISWAVANVVIKYQNSRLKGKDCNMIQYTAWQMTIGSIILFVYTSCMETGQVHWTPMAVACLAYNGIQRHPGLRPGLFPLELRPHLHGSQQGLYCRLGRPCRRRRLRHPLLRRKAVCQHCRRHGSDTGRHYSHRSAELKAPVLTVSSLKIVTTPNIYELT